MSNVIIPYRNALVTGASSGIGEALCHALDACGVERIILVARDETRLHTVARALECDTQVIVADLTRTEDVEQVGAVLDGVDLLINNAGVGAFGPFAELSTDKQVSMVDLNCRTPIYLASIALQQMKQTNHGCIVNIASGMAFQAMPFLSTYAASKSFLLNWSQGVHAELRGTGIRMVAICPGTIETRFAENASVPVHDILGSSLVIGGIEEVVQRTLRAIQHNQSNVITGFLHRFIQLMNQLAPAGLVLRLTAWAMKRAYRKTID